mmetsp:Transcript_57884/g.135921  ORF Transcript_57884/g.135921 Transcript_57884/m.135921 type:complete len:90 (-) Transcript_57884:137-406(-)
MFCCSANDCPGIFFPVCNFFALHLTQCFIPGLAYLTLRLHLDLAHLLLGFPHLTLRLRFGLLGFLSCSCPLLCQKGYEMFSLCCAFLEQ